MLQLPLLLMLGSRSLIVVSQILLRRVSSIPPCRLVVSALLSSYAGDTDQLASTSTGRKHDF